MRRALWLFFCFAITTQVFDARQKPSEKAASTHLRVKVPDVFLVTIDTLRADHVHCYGYDLGETPALDHLAANGIRFTQAFTPSPLTTP